MKKNVNAAETTQRKYEYVAQFTRRCDEGKWCSVVFNSRTNKRMYTLEEAKYEIERLKRTDRSARRDGHTTEVCGGLGISVTHYADYDIIGYRIRKREVIPWKTVEGSEESID